MNIKKWFQSRELWLRWGIIAASICVLLFLFYLFVYFPVYRFFFEQEESNTILLFPTVTGHIFPILSHFIVEGTSLTNQFCAQTEEHCTSWVAKEIAEEENQECIPWTTFEGASGCCVNFETSPVTACADRVEISVFFGSGVLLVLIYFIIGAGIGFFIQKRKSK